MSLIKIKFLQAGRWADHPKDPIFEVEEGEEKEVSADLAKVATNAGKAEFVRPKQKPGPKPKSEAGPEKKAEGKKSSRKAGPIPKAEG